MRKKQDLFTVVLTFLAIILTLAMVIFPEATFKGANYGLETWITILVPALLPFFIIADILIELGFVNFLGVLLEPLMRPVFKQPGASGFVLAMGFTSGFPMGAVLTNTLYEKNLCTKEEAKRLISFTNNSSPLFLLVAIPIGMFHNPSLGILLAISHYGANILLGIILGFGKSPKNLRFLKNTPPKVGLLKRSIDELFQVRQNNPQPLGALIGKAVNKALQTILMIGGFVIFFAVLIEILKVTNIIIFLTIFFKKILLFLGCDPLLGEAMSTGFFEMTMGAQKASEMEVSLIDRAVITSIILGWSGLSIQAQVSSIAAQQNIPISNYLLGRIFQGILAGILTALLFTPFLGLKPVINFPITIIPFLNGWNYFVFNITAICVTIIILIFISILLNIFRSN